MHVRKFKSDKEALLKEGRSIVSESADNKFVNRVSLVNLILSGISAETLSKYCGESKRTLMSWVQKVDDEGWGSLMAKKQEGRPRRLSGEQEEEIRNAIKEDSCKYGYNVWDGPSLSDYIMKKYNVVLGVRACQNLMHRLDFSLIRPQTYPSLENPDDTAREEFKKN
ncbi:MAG: winged helix-turn-helix domain-containing protein [Solobacterium sp.]|nr:winged helix-turn-helix domain-containing protein [Solobacterium sp.]